MAATKKPANTLRSGNVKVTLGQNESAKGPFYSATLGLTQQWDQKSHRIFSTH